MCFIVSQAFLDMTEWIKGNLGTILEHSVYIYADDSLSDLVFLGYTRDLKNKVVEPPGQKKPHYFLLQIRSFISAIANDVADVIDGRNKR